MEIWKYAFYFILGLLSLAVMFALPFLLYRAIGSLLRKLYYHWQDHSTGFLRMKDMYQEIARQQLWELSQKVPDEIYGRHQLDVGVSESSSYQQVLTIPGEYRPTHMYVVGASGSGKSSLLKNLIIQDILSGIGMCVIDPHGDLVQEILPFIGKREAETLYIDLADDESMLTYNPLERREGVLIEEQVAKLVLAFKRIWGDSWGARLENMMRISLTLLIEQGYTLAEYEKLLVDGDFRDMLLAKTDNELVKEYFKGRFEKYGGVRQIEFGESSLNKVTAFLHDPRIALRISHPKSGWNIRELMDNQGILLVNLAKGQLAENADLFGALLMADLEMSFLSRPKGNRKPFAIYADEFQNIATESFETVLAEARKFGVCLTMANQSLKQLDDKLVSLILGNARTQIYFRVSREDSEKLSKEAENMAGYLEERDFPLMQDSEANKHSLQEMWELAFHKLTRLESREAYVMIKGAMDKPEKMRTLDTPTSMPAELARDERYHALEGLKEERAKQRGKLEKQIEDFLKEDDEPGEKATATKPEPPPDLDAID